jgi:hypothetical protein
MLPEDIYENIPGNPDMSYLEGPIGKAYLDASKSVSYKRGDDNNSATFVETYALRATSSLLGEPIPTLRDYTGQLHLWAANVGYFSQCDFVESRVIVNGLEVSVHQTTEVMTLPNNATKSSCCVCPYRI